MRKILLFAAALLTVTTANAKVWRINYDDNAKADFKTISAACAAAKVADSDTLYCEAGYHAGSASDNQISRNGMTVVGPGWGFEANYGNTTTISEARFPNNIHILANNVKLTGVVCGKNIQIGTGTSSNSPASNTYSNITIERCNIGGQIYWKSGYSSGILSDIVIKNCYLTQICLDPSFSHSAIHDLYIEGNIINSAHTQYTPAFLIQTSYGAEKYTNINILHNTIICNIPAVSNDASILRTVNSLIQDNIIINTANQTYVMNFAQAGNIIRKNVFSLSSENASAVIDENYPDNYYNGATVANTFTCQSNSKYRTEEYYQLSENSQAKNAAYDGGDCGAFGGVSPYVICGRPQGIPYIYDVEVPAQPTDNKLRVSFKVKSQNE